MNKKQIGRKLKALRTRLRVTQESIAFCINTQQSEVSRIESGERPLSFNQTLKIRKEFDESFLKDFWEGVE